LSPESKLDRTCKGGDVITTNKGRNMSTSSQQTSMQGNQRDADQQNQAQQFSEGPVARNIEQQTAKLPSDVFLWAAVGSMGVSALFQILGKKKASLFVGDWVSPLLLFGVYNKIVKVQGSDRSTSI
jgi:hypothetical protein